MSYGKVYEEYWEGQKIDPLSDEAALLGLYLITGPHRNAIGCFRLGLGAITDIPRFGKWGIEGVSIALREMSETGFIVRDDKSGWTLVVNALRKDPITGPKTAVHVAQLADRVPKDTVVYKRLFDILSPQLEKHATALADKIGYPMASPIEGVSDGVSKGHGIPNSPLPLPLPLTTNHKPANPDTPSDTPPDKPPAHTPRSRLEEVLDAQHAEAVIDHRKRIRKPLTAHAASLLAAKFAQCPDPNAAADTMIANGWQGFEPSWMHNRESSPESPARTNGAAAEPEYLTFEQRQRNIWMARLFAFCLDGASPNRWPPEFGKPCPTDEAGEFRPDNGWLTRETFEAARAKADADAERRNR